MSTLRSSHAAAPGADSAGTVSAAQCARLLRVGVSTWLTYSSKGMVPAPVERGRWDAEQVRAWAFPAVEVDPSLAPGTLGAADGHGRYAMLDTAEDGRLVCHECGRGVWALGTHVATCHGIDPGEYRWAHGLPRTLPLFAVRVLDRLSDAWHAHGAEHLAHLEASRDPDAARAVSATGARSPYSRAAMFHPRGRPLAEAEVARLDAAQTMAEWAAIAGDLMARGASSGSIAAATGLRRGTVQARLRRARGGS